MRKRKDFTGMKKGRLTAIRFEKTENGKSYWLFKCDCGNEKVLRPDCVFGKGKTDSCGCLHKELASNHVIKLNTTHGDSGTLFYKKWQKMKERCYNKNATSYEWYGALGIKICDRWLDYNNFKEDMYESYCEHLEEYSAKDTTLDRIDPTKDYCKENCRWATELEQANNKKNTIFVVREDGSLISLNDYAREVGEDPDKFKSRYYRSPYNGTHRIPEDYLR